jgi:hypothetical protein
MPPGTGLPAPSRTLLRYLRAQSQELVFFQPRHGANSAPNPPKCPPAVASGSRRRQVGFQDRRCMTSSSYTSSCRNRSTCLTWYERAPRAALFNLGHGSKSHCSRGASPGTSCRRSFRELSTSTRKQDQPGRDNQHRNQGQETHETGSESLSDPIPSPVRGPTWWQRLLGPSTSHAGPREGACQEDVDVPHVEDTIFPHRSMSDKAALDPRLRCTEVDENGAAVIVDGEVKKSELIAKVG